MNISPALFPRIMHITEGGVNKLMNKIKYIKNIFIVNLLKPGVDRPADEYSTVQ